MIEYTPGFRTPLDVREEDEFAGTWRLRAPLVYESKVLWQMVVVPADFITDFASVPRLPFLYLAEGGKGNKAAVVHDYLYTLGSSGQMKVTREQADEVLREALLACGYSACTAWLFHRAVRWGGESHWKAPNVSQDGAVTVAMLQTSQARAPASRQRGASSGTRARPRAS